MSLDDDMPLVTLETLDHGAAAELFEQELERVLDNIMDPNTTADAKRSITVKVEIVPTKSRTEARMHITASSKLAGSIGAGGVMFIGRNRGKPVATSFDPQQQQLKWDEEAAPRALADTEPLQDAHRKAQ